MNIIYDNIIYSLQSIGGISTYWYQLTKRLLKNNDINLAFYETGYEKNNILRDQLSIDKNNVILKKRFSLLLERFLNLPSNKNIDIFHSSYYRIPRPNSRTKIITTIHDFTHHFYYSGPRVYLHNRLKKQSIESSDIIITVSNNTKNDLLKLFPSIDEERVKVIYNGVSDNFYLLNERDKFESPFFLYVGSREPYKNFTFAVEIVSLFKSFNFIIVGSSLNISEKQYINKKIGNKYTVFTNISSSKLNELYNKAVCLLYPSSYEGFGIPLVEAMRAGCPFIALKCSSLPEVAGNAGELLNNLDLGEAIISVQKILNNYNDYITRGLSQSTKFSWDECYLKTYEIYKQIH